MHLGVIPDGNRRYAESKGISKIKAYRKAKDVVTNIFEDIEELPVDIEEATFYLLSEENLRRDKEDLQELFDLMEKYISEVAERLNDDGFVFNWATTKPDAIPEHLQQKLRSLEKEFSEGEKKLNALIAYSGKKDIINAAEKTDNISGDELRQNLEINTDIDYVIRTGDNPTRECLSGFPIWNASYAEFYHLKKNFPAVTSKDVKEALQHFRSLRKKKGE